MKTYTKRTNAKRAAVASGIRESEVELTVHKVAGEKPRFGFKRNETQAVAPSKAVGKAQRAAATKAASTSAAPAQRSQREQRNGVNRPRPGGLCAAVWQWLDHHPDAKLADVRAAAAQYQWNANNAMCELYAWRRFSGAT